MLFNYWQQYIRFISKFQYTLYKANDTLLDFWVISFAQKDTILAFCWNLPVSPYIITFGALAFKCRTDLKWKISSTSTVPYPDTSAPIRINIRMNYNPVSTNVRPEKTLTRVRGCAVWSETSLFVWGMLCTGHRVKTKADQTELGVQVRKPILSWHLKRLPHITAFEQNKNNKSPRHKEMVFGQVRPVMLLPVLICPLKAYAFC